MTATADDCYSLSAAGPAVIPTRGFDGRDLGRAWHHHAGPRCDRQAAGADPVAPQSSGDPADLLVTRDSGTLTSPKSGERHCGRNPSRPAVKAEAAVAAAAPAPDAAVRMRIRADARAHALPACGWSDKRLCRWTWRRMRDSNSRGVAPNTLSSTGGWCSPLAPRPSMTSRNALGVDAGERCWTPVNERQGTETRLASAARSAEGIPESPVNVEAISRTGHKGRREIW